MKVWTALSVAYVAYALIRAVVQAVDTKKSKKGDCGDYQCKHNALVMMKKKKKKKNGCSSSRCCYHMTKDLHSPIYSCLAVIVTSFSLLFFNSGHGVGEQAVMDAKLDSLLTDEIVSLPYVIHYTGPDLGERPPDEDTFEVRFLTPGYLEAFLKDTFGSETALTTPGCRLESKESMYPVWYVYDDVDHYDDDEQNIRKTNWNNAVGLFLRFHSRSKLKDLGYKKRWVASLLSWHRASYGSITASVQAFMVHGYG